MTSPFLVCAAGAFALALAMGVFRLHAFLALLVGAATVFLLTGPDLALAYHMSMGTDAAAAQRLAERGLSVRLNEAFGNTAARIGLLIAFASIVAEGLFRSGAAQAIIRALLRHMGTNRAPAAFTIGSFSLGIPAFSDTVLYLMLPLARTAALRTGGGYLMLVLVVAVAATTTHGLVPPTPGPLFAAAAFGLDLGLFIPLSMLVAAVAVTAGYFGARWISNRVSIPVRPTAGLSAADMDAIGNRPDEALPPVLLALVPLLLPILLISLGSVARAMGSANAILAELGAPSVAMAISAVFALLLMARYADGGRAQVARHVGSALQGAGTIILITVAGGVFGTALQETNVGAVVGGLARGQGAGLLLIGFAISAFVSLSTGSGTIAVITAAGIMASVVSGQTLPFYAGYIALAIGSGAKMFPWMNNSFFWLLCEAGGLTAREALRCFSTLNSFVGLCGLVTVLLLSRLMPLV